MGLAYAVLEIRGAYFLHVLKVTALGRHRMDEIIGHIDIFGYPIQGGRIQKIDFDDGEIAVGSILVVKSVFIAHTTNHLVACFE